MIYAIGDIHGHADKLREAHRRIDADWERLGRGGRPTVVHIGDICDRGPETKDAIQVLPWIFPGHVTYRDKHEKRPGIAIQWVETHGPLDQDYPSLSQQALFGESATMSMAVRPSPAPRLPAASSSAGGS